MAVKKKAVKKKAVKKKAIKKKGIKKKTTPRKRTTSTRSPSRKTPRGSHSASTKGTLGRPKGTGEEKLFLLFKQQPNKNRPCGRQTNLRRSQFF